MRYKRRKAGASAPAFVLGSGMTSRSSTGRPASRLDIRNSFESLFLSFVPLISVVGAVGVIYAVGGRVRHVVRNDARDVHHEILIIEVHQLDALGVAAGDANALDRHSDRHALLRDE